MSTRSDLPRATSAPTESTGSDSVEELSLPTFNNRMSLRQHVAEALRASLVSGHMRPGVLYSAPKLAAQFGVSATPVREAMLDLVSEGLVEVVRNKGFRVTGVSGHELDSLAELRAMIEVPTMALVAGKCEGSLAKAVSALRPKARAIVKAADKKDLVGYIEADTEFHLAFLSLHGNERLVEVVHDLRSRSRLYGLETLANAGKLGILAAEHEQMVDAALQKDVEGMRQLVSQHLGHVRSIWAGDAG
ncbi:GntR family transcriptional regulator [Saxibacter everestensis]|uniref:GntR family transcriptional regulator n=1 Tax=Saxibacter everestensis TaxID=2909229 RepID=A0ABY8QRF1_9MICO|nr:GntR family transcriptional regulator [Brevibacteriaceae bacterium ZFBP1038]